MTYPNRLVKVPDIGALAEMIAGIRGQEEVGRLELPRKQQNVGRKRLSGALELPRVEAVDDILKLYWHGHDWRGYEATLVGLDSNKSCAIVTGVNLNYGSYRRREDAYKVWRAKNGPWL